MRAETIINKMKAILGHIGAWAPMAEQKGVAKFLYKKEAIAQYLAHFKGEVEERLRKIYNGIIALKAAGHQVDAVTPQAAIYLTIKIDLAGKKTAGGNILETQADVSAYLLNEAKLAVVPFYAFGAAKTSPWYRLSVGTCKKEEIDGMLNLLQQALEKLH